MEQLHDIKFDRTGDGSIRLEQQSGVGESDVILLHPEQVRFIARRLNGTSEATASKVADLERKLAILAHRLETLVREQWFRDTVVDGQDGIEAMEMLDALADLASEFDGGRLLPDFAETKPPATNTAGAEPEQFALQPSN